MPRDSAWIVLVSDGDRIEYPPEVFLRESAARREAYRWASSMSASGSPSRVGQPAGWSAGIRDVLVLPADRGLSSLDTCWVVAFGRGPIAGGVRVELPSDRRSAWRLASEWAETKDSELTISPMGFWSANAYEWIDAQRAKLCC
jgi:hypothetical protein